MGRGVIDIDIYKLTNGKHSFDFDFESSFFDLFEDSLIENGSGSILVDLDKAPSMITLKFIIKGEIELICDRSLDKYMFPIEEESEVRLKFGDHWEELSDELILIPANAQKIDIGQFVYEFITLAIPMKKLHPRFQDSEDDVFIETTSTDESSDDLIDPRWNDLKKLKKN